MSLVSFFFFFLCVHLVWRCVCVYGYFFFLSCDRRSPFPSSYIDIILSFDPTRTHIGSQTPTRSDVRCDGMMKIVEVSSSITIQATNQPSILFPFSLLTPSSFFFFHTTLLDFLEPLLSFSSSWFCCCCCSQRSSLIVNGWHLHSCSLFFGIFWSPCVWVCVCVEHNCYGTEVTVCYFILIMQHLCSMCVFGWEGRDEGLVVGTQACGPVSQQIPRSTVSVFGGNLNTIMVSQGIHKLCWETKTGQTGQ